MPVAEELPAHEQYIVDVLLNCAPGGAVPKDRVNVSATPGGIQPCPPHTKGIALVVPVLLATIHGISHLRVKLANDLRPDAARQTAWKSVEEVPRRFPDGVPLLDPVENMGINDASFKELVRVCGLSKLDLSQCFSENRGIGRETLQQPLTQRP